MTMAAEPSGIPNITCAQFLSLSDADKRLFVIGVANGRSMTAGLFEAYAGAAQGFAASAVEREAIARAYATIRGMLEPMLSIDPTSLLNGIVAACKRLEIRDSPVIEALASVHVDVARVLKASSGGGHP